MKKLYGILGGLFLAWNGSAQEVGLQLYSLRNQFKEDVPKTLDLIASWDLTYLEGGDSYGYDGDTFRDMLRERGLDVVSVGASFEDLESDIEKVVANAKAYKAAFVMCAWVPHEGNQWGLTETEHAIQVFNRAGARLEQEGITLAYHAHGYEFRPYKNGTLFDLMAQKADHFAFEMDVYWVHHGGEDPLKLLERYPEKFVLLHLKDMEKGIKGNNTGHEDEETNVVLGTGQVDIAGVVKRAKELGYVKYMFIEDECSRVVEQVPQSLRYLEKL